MSFEDEADLWPRFDAYVKKVVRQASYGYGRSEKKRKREVIVEDVVIVAYMDQGQLDEYPSDRLYLLLDGEKYALKDLDLYDAMRKLPEKLLRVLVLKFWRRLTEDKIAEELKASVRSCYTRRKKALAMLQKLLEEQDEENEI